MIIRQKVARAATQGPTRLFARQASYRTRNATAPPQAAPPPPPPQDATRIARARAIPLTLAAVTAFGIGLYGMQLYISTTRSVSDPSLLGPQTQEELTSVYDSTAAGFDAEVDMSEWLMGIKSARRKVAERARGHVLEVSCGTARNLGYYRFEDSTGVKSLTLADLSLEMVQLGKQKWVALRSGGKLAQVPVRFWHGDVKGDMPPPPVDEGGRAQTGYDTIIQSMGLCSTDDPVEMLKNLARHLDKGNGEARILLLEHGRSYYPWWNRVLDSQAAVHASKHGCWWNRDIGRIVEESGLEVVSERRRNFGTTWIYELRPRRETAAVGLLSGEEKEGDATWGDVVPRWMYDEICKR